MRRFGIFSVIGTCGFVFQTVLLAWLTRTQGWHYAYALPLSAEVALVLTFLWHSAWTWRDRPVRGTGPAARRFARFQVVRLAGLAYAYIVAVTLVSLWRLPPELANTVSVGLASVLNFSLSDQMVF